VTKKIAIIVRDRKQEALRVAVGATLSNDEVNVFIMDDRLKEDEETNINLQMLTDLKVKIFTNNPENQFEQRSTEEIAGMLPAYDVVIPY
jgi:formylmethanofuran dehydrogenase subunit E